MTLRQAVSRRVPCVGAVVTDSAGSVLLVRRGQEPAKGRWSVPGGRVEPGEDDATATRREVLEETGLHIVVGDLAGVVERDAPDGAVFEIHDYHCAVDTSQPLVDPVAGDDAADVGWFRPDEVRGLDCVPGLVTALEEWGVLAPPEG